MRPIESVTFQFVPSVLRSDDPLIDLGYFTWKATIGGRQYGEAFQLDRNNGTDMPHDQFVAWINRSLPEIEKLRRMTPDQAAKLDAEIAARAAASDAEAKAYFAAKPPEERLV